MSNRPTGFKFLGKNYEIEYVAHVDCDSSPELENCYLFGVTNEAGKKIQVRDDLDKNEEVDTTVHEIFHAIDLTVDLELTERQIRVLATSFISILETTPELREYLYANTQLQS